MEVQHLESEEGLEITLKFSNHEVDVLKNDLPGIQGIVDWYSKGPSQQKIHCCMKRIENFWIPKLRERGFTIPTNNEDLLNLVKLQNDYLDRKASDNLDK